MTEPGAEPSARSYRSVISRHGQHALDLRQTLNRAHELRRFEIENYWRRSTYFWGFQLAALAALGFAWKGDQPNGAVLMAISIAGMVTAYTAVLTARGSKFWQQNWERHVDALEDAFEGALHKTVLMKATEERQPSVSRANERLLQLAVRGWQFAFVAGALIYAQIDPDRPVAPGRAVLIVVLAALAIAAMRYMSATPLSDIETRVYRLDDLAPVRENAPTARTG